MRIQRPALLPNQRFTRSLLVASGVTFFGNLVFAVVTSGIFRHSPLPFFLGAHALIGLAVGSYVLRKGSIERRHILAADILLLLPTYFTIWESHMAAIQTEVQFDQMFAPKILMLGWAIFIPASYFLHAIFILGLGLLAGVIWGDMSEAARQPFVPAEPWMTALALFIGLGFTITRWRHERFEMQVIALRAQTEVLSEVAQLFLRIRDTANTPLQALYLAVDSLRSGERPTESTLRLMKRSLEKINRLHREFTKYEDLVEWDKYHATTQEAAEIRKSFCVPATVDDSREHRDRVD